MPTIQKTAKVLLPHAGANILNVTRFNPGQVREMLGDRTAQIIFPERVIDSFGSVDLHRMKHAITDFSLGHPVTCTFTGGANWVFEVKRAEEGHENDIVEVSENHSTRNVLTGKMHPPELTSGRLGGWILGSCFGLKGLEFRSKLVGPSQRVGGAESDNMYIGAAVMAGSILSGADLDLGSIFYYAADLINTPGEGLTGMQGLAGVTTGLGAQANMWLVHRNPYGGLAIPLFGPEQYPDFMAHVAFLFPGKKEGPPRERINEKWEHDAQKTLDGNLAHRPFVKLSHQVMAGYANPDGIDWEQVASAMQAQTDIRVASCPAYFDASEIDLVKQLIIRQGNKVLRGISRTGEGGRGTPIVVYSTSPELTRQAKELIGTRLEITEELARTLVEKDTMSAGWYDYHLERRGPKFEGFEESGFTLPASYEEREVAIEI